MERAKRIMSYYLIGHAEDTWDTSRSALVQSVDEWFKRPLKRNDPLKYVSVEEQRFLRLKIIGDLLGREEQHSLASFAQQDKPGKMSSDNLDLVEARALRTFIDRASLDVHAEVKAEYERLAKELILGKELERQRAEELGKVDESGDVQLYLPELRETVASSA